MTTRIAPPHLRVPTMVDERKGLAASHNRTFSRRNRQQRQASHQPETYER